MGIEHHGQRFTTALGVPEYATLAIKLGGNLCLVNRLADCKVLVIGWGRIGKCLAALLKGLEADVTVVARKETDRAILHALG